MNASSLVRQTVAGLLDLVYPPQCLVCETPGQPDLCESCVVAFVPIPEPICPVCGRPKEGEVCRLCAERSEDWGFDIARAAGVFAGPLRHAVHRLKYDRIEALGKPLGAYLANRLATDNLLPPEILSHLDAIAYVPTDPARERQRGYNQARLLAEPVAEMLDVPLLERALIRTHHTSAQVGLTLKARLSNLDAAAFAVPEPSLIQGRHLLLIDDVFTTGTTLSACAACLKNSGASSVTVVTLAGGG